MRITMLRYVPTICLALLLSTVSLGQTSGAMSPQFKEQARKAFHAIEHLDPDSNLKSQPAHQAVNSLLDKIKTPTDKEVENIRLFS